MILPHCPAIFECRAVIEGVSQPRREGSDYGAKSLRHQWPLQERIQAQHEGLDTEPEGGLHRFPFHSHLCFSVLTGLEHSLK